MSIVVQNRDPVNTVISPEALPGVQEKICMTGTSTEQRFILRASYQPETSRLTELRLQMHKVTAFK